MLPAAVLSQNFNPNFPQIQVGRRLMPRIVVIYRSVSGFTKNYAQWIAGELTADFCDARKMDIKKLLGYEVIIFGGSLHAVGINGVSIIKDNLPLLADKKLVVFAVGASPTSEGIVEEVTKRNFPEKPANLKLFYLRGGFDYGKLDRQNRVLMTLFRAKLKAKRKKTPNEEGMLTAYEEPMDCTNRENVTELVSYVKTLL